jgi:hypothetical protein
MPRRPRLLVVGMLLAAHATSAAAQEAAPPQHGGIAFLEQWLQKRGR